MNSKIILFIDDERFFARPYIEKLESRHQVRFCESIIDALAIIERKDHSFDAIVLDLMMPPPQGLPEHETVEFVDAGLWLLEKCYDQIVSLLIPVVILTNREFPKFKDRFQMMDFPDGLVEIRPKYDTSCIKLLERMDILLSKWDKAHLDG